MSDEDEKKWKKKLTKKQYKILREGKTELPFTGKHLKEKRDGMFHCAACDAPPVLVGAQVRISFRLAVLLGGRRRG